MLALQDVKQNVAAVEKMSGALKTLSDLYIVSTFRLPPKLGGVLLGFYNKQDSKKYLELAIMGKINKGTFKYKIRTKFVSVWCCKEVVETRVQYIVKTARTMLNCSTNKKNNTEVIRG